MMSPCRSKTAKVWPCFSVRGRRSWNEALDSTRNRSASISSGRVAESTIRCPRSGGGPYDLVCRPSADVGQSGAVAELAAIKRDIVARHPFHRKAFLKAPPHRPAVKLSGERYRGNGFFDRIDDEAGDAVVDDLRYRAASESDHRGAVRHRLDHRQPEGLRPIDREQQSHRISEKGSFFILADLAQKLDLRILQQGLDARVVIGLIHLVDLCRDRQRHAGAAGDLDRPVRPFFRGDAADKGEITAV